MSKRNIIRAWKDVEYRNSLSAEERANLPENPAGLVELGDGALWNAVGGSTTETCGTACTACTCNPTCTVATYCGTCDTFCGTCNTYCGSTCAEPVCTC
jgi:mersacidin/lichenicidin family type 2 lantibiotic